MAFAVEFAESVKIHIRALSARERGIVFQAIEEQLVDQPLTVTRNRKPMRPNSIAPWELRVGSLRIFYEIVAEESDVVRILAVGRKEGNRLFIAGQEVSLDEND